MITVGLELTNFINPSLTWKTVSKGRNTPKRSRKPVSKSLEVDQDLGKKQFQQLSGTHSLESHKSDVLVKRRGFGNMEHVPIKKRRFLLRTPSPPPQSPKHCEESKELDSGRCTLEQQTYANGKTEKLVTGIDLSESLCKNSVMENNIENTVSSFNGVLVSNEDFSGITMLAAAACSGGLDCTVGDVEKSKIGGVLKRDANETIASTTILKENITTSRSFNSLGEATGQLIEEGCMANLPINSTERVCLKSSNDDGSGPTNELLRAKPSESVVCTISRVESVERGGSSDTLNNVVRRVEDNPSDSMNKDIVIAGKTTDTFVPRKYWDLNTIMDEWDHPIEDTYPGSCMQSVEVAATNSTSFEKSLNVETPIPAERVVAIESGERPDGQTVTCGVPVSNALSDSGVFPGVVTAFNKSVSSVDVSSDLVTSGLKGNCSLHGTNNHATEITSSCVLESKPQRVVVAEADSVIDKEPRNLIKDQCSLETASQLASTQSSCFETTMAKLKVSDGTHNSANIEALGAPLATISNSNSTPDTSRRGYQMDVPNVTQTSTSVNPTSKAMKQMGFITSENHGGRNLPSLNEDPSEVINNNANVANARGYDCHLEDGEFRESVGHGWEDNEGEDNETEHVDYDSDDREGVIFEAPNDSIQLSAEDSEKLSRGLDKSVDVDGPLQHLSCLSTVDSKVSESFQRGSPLLKPCSGAPLKGVDRVEGDCKGASTSADSIRSRSSNFNSMHHADCPSARHKPLVQTDPCCDPSQDAGLKSVLADSGPEEGRDRVCQPRNISSSRSGYNSMRRGSLGERDNFHGTRMGNNRDNTLDSNSRSKFDRFSGGINRGFREGYHRRGAINHFAEGRRSFSPRENRVDSYYSRSNRKSRSRSRTRSPDFRSERMGRGRLPYQPRGGRSSGRGFNQRPRFNNMGSPGRLRTNDRPMRFHDTNRDSDYEENNHYRRKPLFVRNDRRSRSTSRSYSPDHRPDTRVGSMRAPYQQTAGGRGRRSPPVRVFRQFQRYDNGESPGERFNDNSNSQSSRGNGNGNGNDYDNGGNDFRRKPRNIFERIRQHDDGGDNSRRFQYDDQDNNTNNNHNNNQNFRRNENYGRGGGRRPMDFRREERGNNSNNYNNNNSNNNNNNIRYESDRMFDSGPKQFRGMRGS